MRAHARLSMEYVLGASGVDVDLEAVARRWVHHTIRRDELTWRPWLTTRFDVERIGILRVLARERQGAIVNFVHHGQYAGIFGSLMRYGVHTHVAVLPSLLGDRGPGYEGLRRRQHIATVCTGGATVFPAKGGLDHMRELLLAGTFVGLATDVPGNTPLTMLGRRVSCGSGAARLALELGVPIVPITSWAASPLQVLRVEDPIDPARHESVADLQQAIADAHAPAILAWPEALMEPLDRWRAVDEADIARFGVAETPT